MTDAIDLFGGAGGAAMGMHLLGLVVRPGDREWFMLGRDRGGF